MHFNIFSAERCANIFKQRRFPEIPKVLSVQKVLSGSNRVGRPRFMGKYIYLRLVARHLLN